MEKALFSLTDEIAKVPGSPGDTPRQLAELTGGRANPSDTVEKALVNNPARLNYRLQFSLEKPD